MNIALNTSRDGQIHISIRNLAGPCNRARNYINKGSIIQYRGMPKKKIVDKIADKVVAVSEKVAKVATDEYWFPPTKKMPCNQYIHVETPHSAVLVKVTQPTKEFALFVG